MSCSPHDQEPKKSFDGITANTALTEHTKIFKKGVEKVTDNVYSAIGFGLANSIMIEGTDGLIIVDTLESQEVAKAVLKEFRKISSKPVKAIIYTHNHVDHVFGAQAFVEGGNEPVIYAHETTEYYVQRILNKMRPIIGARSLRMFGNFLDENALVNAGIGPFLAVTQKSTVGYRYPHQDLFGHPVR